MKRKWTGRALVVSLSSFWVGCILFFVSTCLAWESQDPELAKASEGLLGFKVKDKVGEAAPGIKPGMVIDSGNYKQYPELKEVMLESLYNRFDPNSYAPLAPIRIKETDQYHCSKGWIEKSLESAKTVKLGADGLTLEGYVGGYPFINPKNGVELIHWADRSYKSDTATLHPMRLRLYNRHNKPERELRQQCFVQIWKYPTDWMTPVEPNAQNIDYIVSGIFIYPRDVSGTSYVRKRFIDYSAPDEFVLYIPSMRRVRRMSGSDTQDPLFGSDLVWDDYNGYWQKVSPTIFPNDYKMLPPRELLCPTVVDYNWPNDRIKGGYPDYTIEEDSATGQTLLHFGSWQLRWLHMLEAASKDPNYVYGRRVMAFDPEGCFIPQCQMYDQGGRLWRSWVRDANISQKGEGYTEELIDIIDHVNTHRTILDFNGEKNPRWCGPEYADVRFLTKKAR